MEQLADLPDYMLCLETLGWWNVEVYALGHGFYISAKKTVKGITITKFFRTLDEFPGLQILYGVESDQAWTPRQDSLYSDVLLPGRDFDTFFFANDDVGAREYQIIGSRNIPSRPDIRKVVYIQHAVSRDCCTLTRISPLQKGTEISCEPLTDTGPSLSSLPVELRNMIYDELVRASQPMVYLFTGAELDTPRFEVANPLDHSWLGLLASSKECRAEFRDRLQYAYKHVRPTVFVSTSAQINQLSPNQWRNLSDSHGVQVVISVRDYENLYRLYKDISAFLMTLRAALGQTKSHISIILLYKDPPIDLFYERLSKGSDYADLELASVIHVLFHPISRYTSQETESQATNAGTASQFVHYMIAAESYRAEATLRMDDNSGFLALANGTQPDHAVQNQIKYAFLNFVAPGNVHSTQELEILERLIPKTHVAFNKPLSGLKGLGH